MSQTGIACGPGGAPLTEDLMSLVQRGDTYAYQELVRRYQKRVYRVISSYLRDPGDAMEVLQDTFLKVYVARHSWKNRFSFASWLYRIAINASIDRCRRSDRGRTRSLEELMETQAPRPAMVHQGPTPLDQMQARERRRLLEDAVRRLPRRQREVVSLRYFAEMKLEEIAAVLDCPLGTVKSNLHKAILGLKHALGTRKGAWSHESLP